VLRFLGEHLATASLFLLTATWALTAKTFAPI